MLSKKSTPQQDWELLILSSLIRSNRSNRSNQISDCKLFTQIAQDKWGTVSESFWLLTKNEWCEQIAQVSLQKWATMRESLMSLTKNELMSELLVFLSKSLIRSFFRKKRVIRSENQWANSQPWIRCNGLYPVSETDIR